MTKCMIISALIKEFLKLLMIISNQRGLYPVKNNNKLFSSCNKKEIIGGKNMGCFYHFLNKICNFGFQET